MSQATVHLRFARGDVPVKGWRCPSCGDEKILLEDAKAARLYAERMGLGPAHA
jgi:hypothetical protein